MDHDALMLTSAGTEAVPMNAVRSLICSKSGITLAYSALPREVKTCKSLEGCQFAILMSIVSALQARWNEQAMEPRFVSVFEPALQQVHVLHYSTSQCCRCDTPGLNSYIKDENTHI